MGEKNTRKETGKTAASKTLKEKRTAKHDKKDAANRSAQNTDAVTKVKNR
jgi:hypothetical protein